MEIAAPSRWKCIDFLSDIHLDETDQPTFEAWRRYLQTTAADAVFILGDLFEVWVGDDALGGNNTFLNACVAALRQAGERLDLHIMAGNRDFLMGAALMQACRATALADPSVLDFCGQRIVLTHGDALCLADTDYQAFRHSVRSAAWQADFLAKPLAERQMIARSIRSQSEQRKQATTTYADVEAGAAHALLAAHQASLMLHGHTHQPGDHALAGGFRRLVLSDWCLGAAPPRGDVLRLCAPESGVTPVERLQADAWMDQSP
ncbi:MAG: UDP-2,3-diacylglucosamine diphosphatase [Rhodoferax sp.]|nr:UDP-2,3-diacylglucosamine diphosphatase [Rhodoferax sp.]